MVDDMFETYFSEFYVSEQELKEKIYSTLEGLNIYDPEKWSLDLLEPADPSKSSQEILLNLTNSIPELAAVKSSFAELELIESLRLSAIRLTILLNGKRLDHLFIKQLYMVHSNFILGFRYVLATEILSEKLNKELIYDQDKVFSLLTNPTSIPDGLSYQFTAVRAAHKEIERLFAEDEAKPYIQSIHDFEAGFEQYIKDNYFGLVAESFMRLLIEAMANNSKIIDAEILLGEVLTGGDIKNLADGIFKTVQHNTNLRLGRKHGGKREKKGFHWTNERKSAFYNEIESLPKIKNQSCWQFALDELVENEFDSDTISWLKSHPAFKALPDDLFKDAIKVWRKYLERENWTEMKREEKPRSFEFRHALYLLSYPDEFKYSTLETHYYKGKDLASDAQDKT